MSLNSGAKQYPHNHLSSMCDCWFVLALVCSILDATAGLSALTMLNLHGCDLITSAGVGYLSSLTNLQELNLEQCRSATGLTSLTGVTDTLQSVHPL